MCRSSIGSESAKSETIKQKTRRAPIMMAPTEDLDAAGQDGSELQYHLWVVEVRIPRVIVFRSSHLLPAARQSPPSRLGPFRPSHRTVHTLLDNWPLHTRFHLRLLCGSLLRSRSTLSPPRSANSLAWAAPSCPREHLRPTQILSDRI
ncbi:hypothetical protein B0H14DRAFT_3476829 [Mycena olivaceomarginata]|nr:hypothetical protein B0H14DRAFT_3476829 [Mycena olivaceomarginata]